MPASQTPRAKLLRELSKALVEQDDIKIDLRKSVTRVNALMRKLDLMTHRKRNAKARR